MEAAQPPQAPPPPPPAAPPPSPAGDYPVRFAVDYPERLSHWKVLLKWLFAIPHLIILWLLGIVQGVLVFIAFFAILFTKRWPRGMFDFAVQIQRWILNVSAYAFLLMRDEYPPFTGESGQYPVTLEIPYDDNLSRWKIFLKWLFAIPHYIVLLFVLIAAYVVVIIAFFAVLFTGKYPRGMFDFVEGSIRWTTRVHAYSSLLMRDEYPPFSLK
jgi:hypothetical protein